MNAALLAMTLALKDNAQELAECYDTVLFLTDALDQAHKDQALAEKARDDLQKGLQRLKEAMRSPVGAPTA